jgi:Flp pilus assembly protein TadD
VRGMPGAPLISFPESDAALATTRDFALAWETLTQRNVEGASQKAEEFLRKAVKERADDPVLLSALGFVEQKHGREKEARELYERALKLDPLANEAATNLGILEARSGNLRRAVELWQGAERAPHRSAIGMNLAMAFCVAGQKEEARRYVGRVLEFNPDYLKGKQLLAHLGEEPVQCRP